MLMPSSDPRPLARRVLCGALTAMVVIAGAMLPQAVSAQNPVIALEPIADGFTRPVYVTTDGVNPDRLYLVEQTGTVRVIENGALLPDPFMDITRYVRSEGNEQGLLSIAFAPDFATSGEVYAGFTANRGKGTGNDTVARFVVGADGTVDPSTITLLISLEDEFAHHNGGQVLFGPDGMLYAAIGDGGSQGDMQGFGSSNQDLFGDILRLDVSGTDPKRGYTIPADNPFVDAPPAAPEVWVYGLRNPWRFSFDPETDDLWIGDVGQGWIEEIDMLPPGEQAGANMGWSTMEGNSCFREDDCSSEGLVLPVFDYTHDHGCSVTGGYVYRGEAIPALQGTYVFGDYCMGTIWGLTQNADGTWTSSELLDTTMNISSFGVDEAGELYVVDLKGGLYKVTGA